MSKERFLSFLSNAAKDKNLKDQLKTATNHDDLVDMGNEAGYEFTAGHINEAMTDLQKKPGFFGALAEAALELFSPGHDDYPATGVQPFSGDSNPKS